MNTRDVIVALSDAERESLIKHAYYILKSKEDAEDIVQDVMINVLVIADTIQADGSFIKYLKKAITYESWIRIKKDKVMQRRQAGYSETHPKFTRERSIELKELSMQLQRAINDLPPTRKVLFEQHFIEGKKQRDIANERKMSVQGVKNEICKAVKNLRTKLK